MNRRVLILLAVLLVLLLGLVGFYLYLSGGDGGDSGQTASPTAAGLVHVKTIYTAEGENLRRPTGVGADTNGTFFVTLKDDGRVIGFDRNGDVTARFGESGIERGQLLAPLGVAYDRLTGQVYVVDRARLRLLCYSASGQFQWERTVLNPTGVTVQDENLVVTTFGPVVVLTREGEPVSETGARGFEPGQFDYARAAVPAPTGSDVIIADTNNTRVQRVQLTGEATATVSWVTGEPPRYQDDPDTEFAVPSGITTDERGRVYVLDGFRHEINVLDAESGEILHIFAELEGDADGRFNLPTGIANLGGDRFAITDTFNDRVQIVRLILPEEDNIVRRQPWVLALLPLLLLLGLLPLLRRKVYVTREALELAAADESLRLMASAFRKLHVLPEVAEEYSAVVEHDVDLSPYFVSVGEPAPQDDGDATARLQQAVTGGGPKRFLRPRKLIVCSDEAQCAAFTSATRKDYAWVKEEYRLAE